jgi:hypothetical protein
MALLPMFLPSPLSCRREELTRRYFAAIFVFANAAYAEIRCAEPEMSVRAARQSHAPALPARRRVQHFAEEEVFPSCLPVIFGRRCHAASCC